MFKPVKGGSKINIRSHVELNGNEFIFECWLPPVGHGVNIDTGELEKTDILKRTVKAEYQFWERTPLPENWDKKRRAEKLQQQKDPEFYDPELLAFENQEWHRRLCGIWFYNNGKPVYLTGLHYMYLNWWKYDGKFLDHRKYDREFFYCWRYCQEDENCIGLNYITKRKSGKSVKSGIVVYEPTSRTSNAHSGIQGKTDDGADEVFMKAIVNPWKKLPDFFRPIFDTAQGDAPSKELRFFKPSVRGKKALLINYEKEVDELESWIDFGASGVDVYDGPELLVYLSDESGKLKKVSIVERHYTVVPCCEIDGVYKGKMLHTTTIEKDDNDKKDDDGLSGVEYKKLIELSDPFKRDGNGRTLSGLYSLFLPAYETMYIDRYGEPDIAKAKEFFQSRRKALENNSKQLASFIRKNPFTLKEAFDVGSDKCHFNEMILRDAIGTLSWSDNHLERGNIEWINGIAIGRDKFEGTYWVKNKKGRWFKHKDFKFPERTFEQRGISYYPANKTRFASGCDPFQNDATEDSRNSKGASHIKQRYSPNGDQCPLNRAYVLRYHDRPKLVRMFHEDMMKQCIACGTDILIESAKDGGTIKAFENNRMTPFVQRVEGKENAGVYPDENNKVLAVNLTYDYIEMEVAYNHYKILHQTDAEQLMKFSIKFTEKTDCAMSILWTEVADYLKGERIKPKSQFRDITEVFPEYLLEYLLD